MVGHGHLDLPSQECFFQGEGFENGASLRGNCEADWAPTPSLIMFDMLKYGLDGSPLSNPHRVALTLAIS